MGLIAEHDGTLDGYEAVQLPPAPAQLDCRGAAMLRRRSARTSKRAVLYLHCLADSFVPEDLASWYTERGFHFYVADLRPQARLDQPAGGRRSPLGLGECFSALDAMSGYLRDAEAIDTMVVSAHAAGALIAALWCDARRDGRPADALILAGPAFGSGRRKRMFRRLRKAGLAGRPGQAGQAEAAREADADGKTTASKTSTGGGTAAAADVGGLAEGGRLPGLLAGAQRQLRGGLDIACPVLVMCTAADWDAPGGGRRRKGLRHLGGGPGTTRLGPHVTWLRLDEGLTGPLPPGGPESRPFFRELGRWLGAYLSGQFRDQLL
jgi:alpha-beta hydrolase superfamily lysophospholipase